MARQALSAAPGISGGGRDISTSPERVGAATEAIATLTALAVHAPKQVIGWSADAELHPTMIRNEKEVFLQRKKEVRLFVDQQLLMLFNLPF